MSEPHPTHSNAPSPPRTPGSPAGAARRAAPTPPRDPATLFETLDLLPQHLALMTTGGETVRVNRWLAELLRRLPGGRHLEAALGAFACSIAEAHGSGPDGGAGLPAEQEFHSPAGTCRMWGWCVELDDYGLGRMVLMGAQPAQPEVPPDDALRKELGLTRKEVDVVRLLAEGRSNAGIATALSISPHTARHHTERIMAKLGARSRAEVGARLRNPRPGKRR